MAARTWFRNPSWSLDIEAEFWRKWTRARPHTQSQALYIQAYHLVRSGDRTLSATAISLCDHALALPDHKYFAASAWHAKGEAMQLSGDIGGAVHCFLEAMEAERVHPHRITNSRTDFLYLVATSRRRAHYERALSIAAALPNATGIVFLFERFKRDTALALISEDLGDFATARTFAIAALSHAAESHSGLPRHPEAGLAELSPQLRSRLEGLAASGNP